MDSELRIAWLPRLTFFPVNQEVLKSLLRPFSIAASVLAGATGVGALPTKVWNAFLPALMEGLDIEDKLAGTSSIFADGALFAVVALALIWAVRAKLLDFQLCYLVGKAFLLLAFCYALCAVISLFDGNLAVHIVLVALVVLFGTVRLFWFGTLGYYWRRRLVGDAIMEGMVLVSFVYFAWRPLRMLIQMGASA